MQSQEIQRYGDHVERAKKILNARAQGQEVAQQVEWNVASGLLGMQMSHAQPGINFSNAFRATEVVGTALQRALTRYAVDAGLKPPVAGTYDPLFSTSTMFRGVWALREVIEQTEIPYGRYIDSAVDYWSAKGKKRVPRPTQLTRPDVIAYVMGGYYIDMAAAQA